MRRKTTILFLLILAVFITSCGSSHTKPQLPVGPDTNYGIAAQGIIQQANGTTYQYGTHILVDAHGILLYALKSDTIALDDYVGISVTVKGELVSGYPVDMGPDYLNVMRIQ